MDPKLFSKCLLTVSEEIAEQKDDDLLTAITELKFKITDFASLTIEKDNVTEGEMCQLTELLSFKVEPREGDEPFEVLSGNFDDPDRPCSPEAAENIVRDNVESPSVDSQDEIEQLSGIMGDLSISKAKDGGLTSTSLYSPSDNLDTTPSGEQMGNRSAPLEHMSASQTVNSQLPQAASRVYPQKLDRRERMLPTGEVLRQPHPPPGVKRDKLKTSGDQQQAENISSTDTHGVTGIKSTDHEGNIDEMSSHENNMPEGKTPHPRGQEDSNRGSGAENKGKVKNGQRNNSARQGEETARDGKIQTVTASSKKTNKPERKSFAEGHGKGSNEAMDESDVTDVDSLGSDTEDRGKCAMPNHGNKDMQSDEGKRESTEQVSAGQEFVEGRLQVQGQSSVTNQPYGMEQSGENDLSQLTQNHGPVVNQNMTEDVEMTPVDRSNTITETRGSLTEVVPSQGSAVMEVKVDQNATGDHERGNLHHAGQQMRKAGDLYQGGEPYQHRGNISDEDDERERELSHDVPVSQNRRSDITEQVNPKKSLGRPGEKMMKHEEEKAKKQKQAKHHSDDTKLMKDREKQPYGQDRQDSHADMDRSMQGEEPYRESQEQCRESRVLNERRPEQHPGRHDTCHGHSSSEGQTRMNKWGESEERKKNSEYKHKSGSCRQQSADDIGEVNSKEFSRNLNREDSEPSMDEHKEREKQGKMTGKMDRVGGKNKESDNNTNEIDREEMEGAQSELSTQREINFQRGQPHDELEERLRKLKPGGVTTGQNRNDSDEDDEPNMPQSSHKGSGSYSQSSRNELTRLADGHKSEKEGNDPARSKQQGGDNTDEDHESSADSDTPSVPPQHGVYQNQDLRSDNADQDGNETESDSQSNEEDNNPKSASSQRSTRQNGGNPSKTIENEGADLIDNKQKDMKVKHGVKKVSQGDQTTHEVYSGDESTRGRYRKTAAQQTAVKDLEGKDKQEMECDTEIQEEDDSPRVKNPPTTKVVKGQNLQNDDNRQRRANVIKGRTAETELNDGTETKKKEGGKAGKSMSYADQSDTESDEESGTIEYVMKKTHFRLANQYFKGCPEHQYLDMAKGRDETQDRDEAKDRDKAKDKDEGCLLIVRKKDTEQVLFLKSLRKMKFERVGHVEDDKPILKEIADQLRCKDLGVKLLENGSKSYLVGPKEKVADVKQKLNSRLQKAAEDKNTQRQESQLDMRAVSDNSSRSSDAGARPKNFDGFKSSLDKKSNDFSYRGENTSRPQKSENRGKIDLDSGVYAGRYSDIRVHIHEADITSLKVDCIVNAANWRLKHGGGVARVIATAAGKELQEACEKFTSSGNTVEITGVFVSPGGRLPAKHVLHAVGPMWEKYNDKNKCTDDLRRTVLRCLVEAMRLGMSSIALPSISAAIFKVPKELCARSYMEAVKSFDAIFGKDKDCTLKEIHFVDIDDIMVNYIQESFMKYWKEPCDSFKKRMDEQFSQDYLSSKKPLPPKSGASSTLQISENQGYRTKGLGGSPAPQTKPLTTGPKTIENESEYQIRGIRLFIVSKPALSIHTDPIITIGEDFDKLSGIEDYRVKSNRRQCKDYPTQKQAFEFAYLCKPKGQHLRVLCSLHPDPKSPDEIKSAVDKLDVALRMLSLKGGEKKDVTSFVLTSSILYAEPNNKKKEYKSISQKLAGSLAHNVFEFLDTVSQDKSCSLKRVFIAASKDALPHLYKVFDSRDVAKKVDSAAQGSYHHNPGQRGQSPARFGSSHRDSSSYPRQTNFGRQYSSGDSKREPSSLGGMASQGATDHGSSSGSPVDQWLVCGICTFVKRTVKNTSCCGILLCSDCNDRVAACPYCRKPWRIRTGDQPRGYMTVSYTKESADGYESKGSWKIEYSFPGGTQTAEHPNPGKWYSGTTRTAYIPATEDSMGILKLLRLAFIRRLTFTVGVSRTTGEDNKITWNDIHHKTKLHGGNFGFPDATYFTRVIQELRAKGVTLESMTETEISSIGVFEERLNSFYHYFSDYTSSVYSSV